MSRRAKKSSLFRVPESQQFRRSAANLHIPAQASSSSKSAYPSLRACVGDKPRCLIRACTKGRHFGARPTSSVKREMKAACRLCDLSVGYAMLFSRRWMHCCRKRNAGEARLNGCPDPQPEQKKSGSHYSTIRILVPSSVLERTSKCPLCLSTIHLAIERPSPVPALPRASSALKKRSNM